MEVRQQLTNMKEKEQELLVEKQRLGHSLQQKEVFEVQVQELRQTQMETQRTLVVKKGELDEALLELGTLTDNFEHQKGQLAKIKKEKATLAQKVATLKEYLQTKQAPKLQSLKKEAKERQTQLEAQAQTLLESETTRLQLDSQNKGLMSANQRLTTQLEQLERDLGTRVSELSGQKFKEEDANRVLRAELNQKLLDVKQLQRDLESSQQVGVRLKQIEREVKVAEQKYETASREVQRLKTKETRLERRCTEAEAAR